MVVSQPALFPEPPDTSDSLPGVQIARCKPGDLWALGRHRLLCGDCTDREQVQRLLGNSKVDTCLSDPPYGIAWDGNYLRFTGGGKWKQLHSYAPIANDHLAFDPAPLLSYPAVVLWGANNYANRLPPGAWLVWDKRHTTGKAFLADGEVAWMNRGHGVYLYSLVWQGLIKGVNEPGYGHPTQKPVKLFEWCLLKMKAGQQVYDPYLGSGTTLIACERTQRTCCGCEIEPAYCDTILARWEQATGKQAQLLERMGA